MKKYSLERTISYLEERRALRYEKVHFSSNGYVGSQRARKSFQGWRSILGYRRRTIGKLFYRLSPTLSNQSERNRKREKSVPDCVTPAEGRCFDSGIKAHPIPPQSLDLHFFSKCSLISSPFCRSLLSFLFFR